MILNIVADKATNTDKQCNTVVNKKLNTIADNTVNADKKQNAIANK